MGDKRSSTRIFLDRLSKGSGPSFRAGHCQLWLIREQATEVELHPEGFRGWREVLPLFLKGPTQQIEDLLYCSQNLASQGLREQERKVVEVVGARHSNTVLEHRFQSFRGPVEVVCRRGGPEGQGVHHKEFRLSRVGVQDPDHRQVFLGGPHCQLAVR